MFFMLLTQGLTAGLTKDSHYCQRGAEPGGEATKLAEVRYRKNFRFRVTRFFWPYLGEEEPIRELRWGSNRSFVVGAELFCDVIQFAWPYGKSVLRAGSLLLVRVPKSGGSLWTVSVSFEILLDSHRLNVLKATDKEIYFRTFERLFGELIFPSFKRVWFWTSVGGWERTLARSFIVARISAFCEPVRSSVHVLMIKR